MPYNAIEYDRENNVIKIANSYKDRSKQAIPSESKEKIEKYCDNFFEILSTFLKDKKYDKDDLDTAINIFFYSLESSLRFKEVAIPLKHKESASNFKKNFPSFITLLNSSTIENGTFLGIDLGDSSFEDICCVKKLMQDTVKDIFEDISGGEFALDNRLPNLKKKDSIFAINWSDAFDEKFISNIKVKNKLEFFSFNSDLSLNESPSLNPNVIGTNPVVSGKKSRN
jgi:hypothetical protein